MTSSEVEWTHDNSFGIGHWSEWQSDHLFSRLSVTWLTSLDVITRLVKRPYFAFHRDLIPSYLPTSPHPNLLQNSSSFISIFNTDSSLKLFFKVDGVMSLTPGNWMCVCAEQNWRQCSCTKLKKIKKHISVRILIPNYSVFSPTI